MASYSNSSYLLSYSASFDTLLVKNSDGTLVEQFSLSTAHELKVQSGNYVIDSSSVPTNWHMRKFKALEGDTLSIQATDHLGVSDLRIERVIQTSVYHLDECPIRLKYDGDGLCVYAQCTGNCAEPLSKCCTTTEQSY